MFTTQICNVSEVLQVITEGALVVCVLWNIEDGNTADAHHSALAHTVEPRLTDILIIQDKCYSPDYA